MYKHLMGCSLFSTPHFQMGVTVMGFAEHFGLNVFKVLLYIFFLPFKLTGCFNGAVRDSNSHVWEHAGEEFITLIICWSTLSSSIIFFLKHFESSPHDEMLIFLFPPMETSACGKMQLALIGVSPKFLPSGSK